LFFQVSLPAKALTDRFYDLYQLLKPAYQPCTLCTLRLTLLFLFCFILASTQAFAQENSATVETEIPNSLITRIYQPFMGDLDELRKRRIIRVLTTYSRTNYFITPRGFRGIEYELLKAYERYLNRGPRKQRYQTQLIFLPTPFKEVIHKLQKGYGDIAAAGLTITPEREALIDFTDPYISDINEILVTHTNAEPIKKLEDLSGKTITVVADSSYIIHLNQFNQVLGQLGLPPMEIRQAPALLGIEDLLEMVNNSVIDYTVADSHIAQLWHTKLKNLILQSNIIFHYNGKIAWGLHHNTPKLKASLNHFIHTQAKPGRLLGNSLFKKYFEDNYWIQQPTYSLLKRIPCLMYYFQLYGGFYDIDWNLIAAQAYQESRLNHQKVSHKGAVGIMQVKPETSRHKPINIPNIHRLENNIEAGVKYLAYLRDRYFSDPNQYNPEDQINFALAAYNAGPTKIRRMQRLAKKQGLDPNKWFYNVEVIVRQEIGQETVNYVANIRKYQIALQMSRNIEMKKALARLESASKSPALLTEMTTTKDKTPPKKPESPSKPLKNTLP